jgi:carbonic anhydrase
MSNQKNINISVQNIKNKCDLKCSYNFKYHESNITAKNNDVFISLSYDNSSVAPVLYNNEKYTVSSIMITCPSIHVFNGIKEAAEIIIVHVPVKGGNHLSVAIPIKASTESSSASILLNEIIQNVATNAPKSGESTNINLTGFTLDKIVPNKPFYSYTNNNMDWIVFGNLEAIPLNNKILEILKKIIKPFSIPTQGSELFFNSSGPNTTSSLGEGIYISCQPTGSSVEETTVSYDKNEVSYDLGNNPTFVLIFQIFISCLIFIILFFILNFLYTLITSSASKLSTLKIPKFNSK